MSIYNFRLCVKDYKKKNQEKRKTIVNMTTELISTYWQPLIGWQSPIDCFGHTTIIIVIVIVIGNEVIIVITSAFQQLNYRKPHADLTRPHNHNQKVVDPRLKSYCCHTRRVCVSVYVCVCVSVCVWQETIMKANARWRQFIISAFNFRQFRATFLPATL